MDTNLLYYGDKLDILRRYLPDAYLDPPFNSNRDHNVIFRDESGNATDAQLLAFEDTWHWGPSVRGLGVARSSRAVGVIKAVAHQERRDRLMTEFAINVPCCDTVMVRGPKG